MTASHVVRRLDAAAARRATVCVTDERQTIERRQFLRVAANGAIGVVLVGSPLIASCASSGAPDGGSVASQPDGPPSSTAPDPSSPPDSSTGSSAPPTSSDVALTGSVWRLSTRGQRAACVACKSHAAHRYYASAEAAGADRAHPGCRCVVLEQPVPGARRTVLFGDGARVVVDDRKVGAATSS